MRREGLGAETWRIGEEAYKIRTLLKMAVLGGQLSKQNTGHSTQSGSVCFPNSKCLRGSSGQSDTQSPCEEPETAAEPEQMTSRGDSDLSRGAEEHLVYLSTLGTGQGV